MIKPEKSDLERVLTAFLFFVSLIGFLIASIWIKWAFIAYCVVMAILIANELINALKNKFKPLNIIPVIIASLSFLAPIYIWVLYRDLEDWYILLPDQLPLNDNWSTNFIWLLAYGVLIYVIVLVAITVLNTVIRIITKGPNHLPHSIAENSVAAYVATAFVSVVLFTFAVPNGFYWLIFALFTPMIVDVAAFFVGKYFGKKKMLPKLSPHKTWEGFWGGMLTGTAFGSIFFMILFSGEAPLLPLWQSALFGIGAGFITSLTSQLGDWYASGIKRWCEQKDFGKFLKGHGGFLDRFDSILFSLPTTLVLSLVFFLLKR